jgi:hypothetical protein
MCLYFEEKGIAAEPEDFKKVIPDQFCQGSPDLAYASLESARHPMA